MSALKSDEESRPESEAESGFPVLPDDLEVSEPISRGASDSVSSELPIERATALLRGSFFEQFGSSESHESVKTGYSSENSLLTPSEVFASP